MSQIEPALNASTEANALLECLPDGILLIRNGIISRATVRAAELLGISVRKLENSRIEQSLPPGVGAVVERVQEGASSCTGRDLPWERTGAPPTLTVTAVRGPALQQVVLSISPGSDPRSPSSATGFRRRLAWLDSMAAGIAHEIRNPLGGIRGAAQLLGRAAGPNDEDELLGLIIDQSDRIDRLVERLMSLTRPQPLQCSPVSLNHLVHDEVQLLQAQAEGSRALLWDLDLDPSIPTISGDALRLREAIGNLLRNAWEAADSTIVVRTRVDSEGRVHEDGADRGLPICVEVTDDGAGIADDRVSQLFDPFATTKAAGTGLGLFVARVATEDHGGRLTVEPREGQGARFTLLVFEHLPTGLDSEAEVSGRNYRLHWTAPSSPTDLSDTRH